MPNTKILIAVKTYPTLSEKYDELVCTAGFREDGTWIRIYPVPFRKLDYKNQYNKWQWIEMDIVKNTSDFRKESFRPIDIDKDFMVGKKIGTQNNWAVRKDIVLKNVHTNMDHLIEQSKKHDVSLATLKPKVLDFVWQESSREWDKKKLDTVQSKQLQGNLFQEKEETKKLFQVVKKLPYEFSYIFETEDGKERKLMIEDWELGQLYWNCLESAKGDEDVACRKVREKFFVEFTKSKELYFFLGTTKRFHNIAPNPFIIIGVFYPPKFSGQTSLW